MHIFPFCSLAPRILLWYFARDGGILVWQKMLLFHILTFLDCCNVRKFCEGFFPIACNLNVVPYRNLASIVSIWQQVAEFGMCHCCGASSIRRNTLSSTSFWWKIAERDDHMIFQAKKMVRHFFSIQVSLINQIETSLVIIISWKIHNWSNYWCLVLSLSGHNSFIMSHEKQKKEINKSLISLFSIKFCCGGESVVSRIFLTHRNR